MFEHLDKNKSDSIPIHSSWIRTLKTEEERENFKKSILAARHVLRRLREIVNEERTLLNNQETSIEDFKDTDWPYKQAFRNGERKGLKYVEDLLHFL